MGECICPLSCSVLYNFVHDVVKGGWAMGMQPLPSPAWADFTLMIKFYARKWSLPLCVLCDVHDSYRSEVYPFYLPAYNSVF